MITKRQFLKTKPVCKVTFRLIAPAEHVCIAGDFNSWSAGSTPMKKGKDGSFTITIDLETGREHQFRYLLDGKTWINDEAADRYERTPLGNENSVVSL
ncbi:MAG TPA: isoamylase early set domain-containing protein [Bacteroidales bacterium]|nr:isoamylase early set domain-containing protein [Bacteroidales bacterium]HPT02154.1 isoamylase early set domain-containing protein [Bacteroidales bacterium]